MKIMTSNEYLQSRNLHSFQSTRHLMESYYTPPLNDFGYVAQDQAYYYKELNAFKFIIDIRSMVMLIHYNYNDDSTAKLRFNGDGEYEASIGLSTYKIIVDTDDIPGYEIELIKELQKESQLFFDQIAKECSNALDTSR